MACLEGCGVHGECVAGACVCDEYWSQSLDLQMDAPFRLDNTSVALANQPCDESVPIMRLIYCLIAAGSIFTVLLHIVFIRKWKHVPRVAPILVSNGVYASLAVLKLNNLDVFFGVDVALSLLLAIAFCLSNISGLVFLSKYITFQIKLITVSKKTYANFKFFKRLQVYIFVLDIVISGVVFAPTYFEDEKSLLIFRIGVGLFGVRGVYTFVAGYYFMTALLKQLAVPEGDTPALKKLRAAGKSIRQSRASLLVFEAYIIGLCFATAIFDEALSYLKYLFPLIMVMNIFLNLSVQTAYKKKQIGAFVRTVRGSSLALFTSGIGDSSIQLLQRGPSFGNQADIKA